MLLLHSSPIPIRNPYPFSLAHGEAVPFPRNPVPWAMGSLPVPTYRIHDPCLINVRRRLPPSRAGIKEIIPIQSTSILACEVQSRF